MSEHFAETHSVPGEVDAWIVAAYPDIAVSRGERLLLRSNDRSRAELKLILKAAMVNETALRCGERRRAEVMDLLLR